MKYILNESDEMTLFQGQAGGKATNLAKLSQKGFTVPEWFCLSVTAYDEFVRVNQLEKELQPTPPFADFEKRVQELFLKAPLPEAIKSAILDQISSRGLEDTFLAVRSSGLDEDSADNSFAPIA